MPRTRSIKPDFFKDEDIACLPMACRLFFAGLWCQADRDGRLEYRPKRLKVEIMPFDDVSIEDLCHTLISPDIPHRPGKSFVSLYEVDGQQYMQILNFRKHQHPHHLEKPSDIPKPHKHLITDNNGTTTVIEPLDNGSTTVTEPLDNGSNPVVSCLLSLVSGNGSPAPRDQSDAVFQKLLEVYPEAGQQIGVADGQALIYFRQEVIHADHGPILQAARKYAASERVQKGFVKDLMGFLRDGWWRNWTDVKPQGGAVYVPDRSLYEERDKLAAEKKEREAKGIKPGPTRRPTWKTTD